MDKVEELLEGLLKQYRRTASKEALSELLGSTYRNIYLAVLGKVSVNDAADVTQVAMVQVACGLPKFRGESAASYRSWCYQITRAQIAKYYHAREKNAEATHPDHAEFERLINIYALENNLSEVELLEMREINQQLRAADPDGYELIYRHAVLGDTFRTIGEDLGISEDAAGMRFRRCVEKYLGGNYA